MDNNTLSHQISFAIDQVRISKGLNRTQFALLMGVSPATITNWLSGDHNFTLETLAKIQAKLEFQFIYIVKRIT